MIILKDGKTPVSSDFDFCFYNIIIVLKCCWSCTFWSFKLSTYFYKTGSRRRKKKGLPLPETFSCLGGLEKLIASQALAMT